MDNFDYHYRELLSCGMGWRNRPTANFFLIPFRAWELLVGALVAILVGWRGRRAGDALASIGLVMVLASLFLIDENTPFPSGWTIAPVVGTALVITWGVEGSWIAAILGWKPMTFIGLISYSAYLWHQPLFAFARIKATEEPTPTIMAFLVLATFILAWITWLFVEQPFRKKAPIVSYQPETTMWMAFVALVVMAGIGFGLRFVDDFNIRKVEFRGLSESARNQLLEERLDGIRAGTCHYNKDTPGGVDQFIINWSCGNMDELQLLSLPLGFYGDSQAADRAFSVRQAGFDVAQMTAAGCPLIPDGPREKHCDILLDAFHVEMKRLGIEEVLIANRFQVHELNASYLDAIVDYWSDRYRRIYLFTPMPYYEGYERALQFFPLAKLAGMPADNSSRDAFKEVVLDLNLRNVVLLDSYILFCGLVENCSPVGETTKLVDGGHLSAYGASVFGRNLATHPGSPLYGLLSVEVE